jgi:hypothetical protein
MKSELVFTTKLSFYRMQVPLYRTAVWICRDENFKSSGLLSCLLSGSFFNPHV